MVDIPGFLDVPASGGGARGLDEKILHHARTAEALALVVRAFERPSVPMPGGGLDPVADLNAAWTDMVVADLGSAEKRLEKLKSLATKGGASDEEKVELEALQRVAPHLEEGGGVAGLELSGEEERLLRGFGFLTLKPLVIVVNTGEEALPATVAPEWTSWGKAHDAAMEFAAEYGVALDAAEEVIREAYRALDVVTFYTAVGDKEARAWTIPRSGTALDAAAAVHTDMARGFIRAEVINVQVLLESGTWAEAKKSGLLRQEGKSYLVEDGDVINIKFAV
jgi:ribosome-binding ATPase YchF (GTP1/OBG family)